MTGISLKNIFLVALLAGHFVAPAQLNLGAGNNEPLGLSLGINSGVTVSFTDVNKNNLSPVYGIRGTYRPINLLEIVLDIQKGTLSAGKNEINRRYFKNNYGYGSLSARVYPALFAKTSGSGIARALSFGYLGAGIALLKSQSWPNQVKDKRSGYLHYYDGIDVVFPLDIGINIPLIRFKYSDHSINLDLNGRTHFSLSDDLDGYNATAPSNKSNDSFSQLNFGITYCF